MKSIVSETEPVTLVGGGQATLRELHNSLTLAPICVAADSGAVLAHRAGVELAAIIGDFDSVPGDILSAVPIERQHRIAEQTSTDFEKALSRIEAPLVIGVGFTGRRVDHQLAAFHTLLAFAHRPVVLLAGPELVLLAPPRLALPTRAGDVVSLFPLVPVTGRSSGLAWPIDGLTLAPGGRIGTSNRATGPCEIQATAPGLLTILPARLIRPVVAALMRPDAERWPARA